MALRLYIASSGMKISKPGFNANIAAEDDLLFSTDTRHLMQVGRGSFTLSTQGMFVPFGFTITFEGLPLVLCGDLTTTGVTTPTTVVVGSTGFNVWALEFPLTTGSYPALGIGRTWVAFKRQQG